MVRSMGHSVHAKDGKILIIVNLSMFVSLFFVYCLSPSFDMTPEFKPFINHEYSK